MASARAWVGGLRRHTEGHRDNVDNGGSFAPEAFRSRHDDTVKSHSRSLWPGSQKGAFRDASNGYGS
jgi:hypothetical protein